MMDRNLGAISAVPGDVLSVGLLYQWGRKDPFLNICEFGTYDTDPSDNKTTLGVKESKSTITWPETVTGDKKNGTIAYAIEHPTTFIEYYNNLDWLYASSSSLVDKTRWQSSKTIYDPCPAGWRVPDGGENGIWVKHGLDPEGEVWNCPYLGVILKTDYNEDIWYPMSTYRFASSGALENGGISAFYWSVTYAPNSNYIIALGIASYSPIYGLGRGSTPATLPNWKTSAAYGYSVRCCNITE
jgi:hypothetical protein